MEDPRVNWIKDVLVQNMQHMTANAVENWLVHDNKALERIITFFESGLAKNSVIVFVEREGKQSVDLSRKTSSNISNTIEIFSSYIPNPYVAKTKIVANTHCVFLLRTNVHPITLESIEEAKNMQSGFASEGEIVENPLKTIEIVSIEVPSLVLFHKVLARVFLPYVEDVPRKEIAQDIFVEEKLGDGYLDLENEKQESGDMGKQQMHAEVVTWIRRLDQHLSGYIKQLGTERKLPMPVFKRAIENNEQSIKAAASNEDVVKDIDATIILWHAEISNALQQENQKGTPLGEIEYWREKYSALSALYEQVNSQELQVILKVAAESDCNSWHTISATIGLLVRQYMESKDNVKFLSTLDRHFRIIHMCDPSEPEALHAIKETIPSMLIALRMVWIISRYFNTEVKVVGLLEKISREIAFKVSRHIDFANIFKRNPIDVKNRLRDGQETLLSWKNSYLTVQEEINQGESEQRWEFDTKRLFDITEYMVKRCTEMLDIVCTVEYYNALLGSQIKLVVTDASGVDKLLKELADVKRPTETITFDPFERKAHHDWQLIYTDFKMGVAALDQQVPQFISRIFDDDLRSAESVFELLQSFKKMNSRFSGEGVDMAQIVASKTDKILQQHHNELERVKRNFVQNQDKPPLTKNQPPIAGSIHWVNSLYQRLKKPMIKFLEEGMLGEAHGKRVRSEYVELCREMKEYATIRFEKWRESVKYETQVYLKAKIFRKETEDIYVVNFNNKLFEIIKESEYLDRLGFDIPNDALNVTLQDESYHNYVDDLKVLLSEFSLEMAALEASEKAILQKQIQELKVIFLPGFTTLNWVSLGIPHFIIRCTNALTEFRNISRELRKNAEHIQQHVINKIGNCQLLPDTSEITYTGDFPELHHIIESVEHCRQKRLEACLRAYGSIPPLLLKIERNICGSNTGKYPIMMEYYAYWERKMWKALLRMVINSLSRLATLLGIQRLDAKGRVRPSLFKVVFQFASEPTYLPNQQEIVNSILKISRNVVESTKLFTRWMHGTCIDYSAGTIMHTNEAMGATGAGGAKDNSSGTSGKALHVKGMGSSSGAGISSDPLFSFYTDIENSSHVIKLQEQVRKVVQSRVADLEAKKRALKEDKYRSIYASEKKLKVDAQLKDNLHWLDYDAKFQTHHHDISKFDTRHVTDVGFMRCDEGPYFNVLIENLNEWIRLDGSQLSRISQQRMEMLQKRIDKFVNDMAQETTSIEGLKAILETMASAQNVNLDIECEYREIEYMYDSLLHYGFFVDDNDLEKVKMLRKSWQGVIGAMKTIHIQLAPKKLQYSQETKKEIQGFMLDLQSQLDEFRKTGPSRDGINLTEGVALKDNWRQCVRDLQIKREQLAKAEKLFGLPLTNFVPLQQLSAELTEVEIVYQLYENWMECLKRWNRTNWKDIQIEDLQKGADEKVKQARIMSKKYGKIHPFLAIQQVILDFYASLPLLTKLKSPALKQRHWKELQRVTEKEFNLDNITLDDIVSMELHKFEADIDIIVLTASRELGVEKEIEGIKEFWASKELTPVKYAPRKGVFRCYVLTDTSEIQEMADDHILKIQALSNVKWVQPFIEDVKEWGKKLSTINEVIGVWVEVQMKWQYLESIFKGSEDIVNQLPKETQRFNELDIKWIKIMAETTVMLNVDLCCNVAGRLVELKYINEKLDECQKDLVNYLESKRCIFPRFYFISDDELLSILASSGARSVQDHMLKMFDNCAQLVFKGSSEIIEGVESQEKEYLPLNTVIDTTNYPVEDWLNMVLSNSKSTLRSILKAAVFYYPKMDRLEWVKKFHGMINLCGCKIWWTFEVEDAFMKVKKGKKSSVKDLTGKLSMQLSELVSEMDKDIDKLYRKKVNTLIIVDVHGRDIVDRFVRDSVMDAREFDWESQLRFYWDKPTDTCQLRQCTGQFDYGYEFMGLNGRLVITPLTDRCFMTLTQALTFYLGGAPGGPAGTGKTESVKDLAKAMAIQCVVFNCGEGLDYKAMRNIFSGLSQAGSWGCFDEFNRIELPVLSVVSEQLRSIQSALKLHESRFLFGDKEINLISTVGVFITMNPGYAGRVELPDNLKALFRPVVMVLPDMELIAENMLFSEGFTTARELAKKMVTLYSLARGQLSKQYHYDWGLRALKAVLVMAGQLKRGSPDLLEKSVLMRALRDMNSPKFIAEDEPLFKGLIGDLFPGLDPTRVPQEKLSKAATKVLHSGSYKIDSRQVDKVVQLYETMQTRHTTMVVGPTLGGKSVVINTLAKSQDELKLPTKLYIINPKAQPTTVLYGWMDPMTRNWTDGIFSNTFRQMNRIATEGSNERERRYVVFDGDVDAKWVEDMNSVMDDNKLLTLPNGERIRLQPSCSLLFEVGDLQYASPATVSRVGMVYLDPINLGWQPYAYSWMKKQNKEIVETITEMFEQYCQPLISFVIDGITETGDIQAPPKFVIPTQDLSMIRQLCTMLSNIFVPQAGVPEPRWIQSVFIFCCVWSIGALISTEEDRIRFDQQVKSRCGWPLQDSGDQFLTRFASAGSLPEQKTLFDYFFDLKDGRWKPWQILAEPFERPADGKFSSILVSTVDTEKGMWLLEKLVSNHLPVMFVGESGTAKTVTIQAFLRRLKDRALQGENVISPTHDDSSGAISLEPMLLEMNFSSRTTSLDAQRTLEDNIEKRTNLVLGPPCGKRLLVFIDDINMPKVDLYGTQQPIAFLKLLLEHGSWYDRKDLIFKQIRDIQFLAAMAPPGGGRNALDPRFVALFNVFNIPFPSDESLGTIYRQILADSYTRFGEEIAETVPEKITSMTLLLYKTVEASLPATPAKFHYIFNLRDLSRVYEALCRATPEKCPDVTTIVRLWRNEIIRVFIDRMSDDDDKALVNNLIKNGIQEYFPTNSEAIMRDPLLWGDFGDFERDSEVERLHLYEDLGSYQKVRAILEEVLEEVNNPVMKMDLVMFNMAIDHLMRITRVISLNRGHCLLVGVGGSGKQSLTRLAAAICQMAVFEISLSRGYNEDTFREDLKKLFKRVGVEKQKIVFLFTDNHVKQEGFLELINNMLASGMVPALFPEDEKEQLYNSVIDELNALNMAPSKDNKWNLFVNRCRDNLHIVLSMTPSGGVLRTRCRNFPSLINNTCVDWFQPWPSQALEAVAHKILAKEDFPDELRESIIHHAVHVHQTSHELSKRYLVELKRHNYVTPKNFLAFLDNYSQMLQENRDGINDIVSKYKTGLERLAKASEDVAVLSKDLAEKEIDLAEKTKLNDAMIAEITESKKNNEFRTEEVKKLEEELSVKNKDIEVESAEAQQILEEALPEFERASEAVSNISKDDINELKAFANPQAIIKAVVQMVCVFNSKNATWEDGKIMMNNPAQFINTLKSQELRDSLDQRKMNDVTKIKRQFPEMNWLEKLSSASKAAFGLMTWVEALTNWYAVARVVKPKQARVAQLMADKEAAENSLRRCQDEIAELLENQRQLQERLDAGLAEAKKLAAEAAIMKRRLDAANRLINGFKSEKIRWKTEMTQLGAAYDRLIGDCLCAAAFVCYVGAFTFYYREHALNDLWLPDIIKRKIPLTDNFKIHKLLTNEVETSQWASDGLPSDDLSVQNGILTTVSTKPLPKSTKNKKNARVRFPLCIDPQMQAVNWIKRRNQSNSRFEVASFNDHDFLKRLEFCIQYGNPFLFENVDEFIDPVIEAVLDPVFKDESGQKMIKLGDKELGWDDNFCLFLCTKIANPSYPPEVFGKMLVINYGVTEDGLENQLLNYVVASERSDLQAQSEELVQTMAENRAQLKQLEDTLIRELTLATGNILDNDDLIATLENTKSSASEVEEKLTQARETARITDISRQEYRPVAKRGATLYFMISKLSAINSMYEYSLGAFLTDVFSYSIAKSEPSFEIDKRLINIINALNYNLYCYVCIGVFEKHKLMVSFQIATRILASEGRLVHEELEFFVRGCVLASKDFHNKPFDWLTTRQWNDVCKLASVADVFHNIVKNVEEYPDEWHAWCNLDRPEDPRVATFPHGYGEKMTDFQQLCLLRCFRPDRVYIAVQQFIANCDLMGDKFTVPPILRYKDVFDKSTCMSPIVCIVSPGANPTDEIIKLAEKEVGLDKLRAISLGQGQGADAMRTVDQGSVRGHWVVLQNCHLLVTWMQDLEKVIEKRDVTNPPHSEFRLWLTTEPSPEFPMGILQKSLKVVNEPPNGLKLNMKNTLSKVTEDQLEACSHPAFRALVYTLSFFHAVVQERRKYGKIGWNVIYDFNETDFTISMQLLSTYLAKAYDNHDPIPWDTLRYLVGEAMYGGRVTDSIDRRIVNCYLQEYFGDFLFDTFQTFHFFQCEECDYMLPPGSGDFSTVEAGGKPRVTLQAINETVELMPLDNGPDLFGLHPNAETGYLKDSTELLWENLIELLPRQNKESGSGHKKEEMDKKKGEQQQQNEESEEMNQKLNEETKANIVDETSREVVLGRLAEEILAQIPEPFDRKKVFKSEKEKAKLLKQENLQPVPVVLLQETERWNLLVTIMVSTLKDLQKALTGVIGMSAALDELAASLDNGHIPAQWRKYAPATRKNLGRWLAHFQRRYEQYSVWIQKGEPTVMWISGLMVPDSYLSALVQITCRKYVWPLDRSTIFATVTKYHTPEDVFERPKDGAYITGLYLEGARWDNKNMCLAVQEKKVLIYEMPVMQILPMETSKMKTVGTFKTPVYVTRDKRNAAGVGLVFEADLVSKEHESKWILESVSLCLNSDD